MRKYYVLFLTTLFIWISETSPAQSLVRNFSHHLSDVLIMKSISLSNGDLVIYGETYRDLNTHPVYATYISVASHFISCYSYRGEYKWHTTFTVQNLLETTGITTDQNNNIYLGATFVDTVTFQTGGIPLIVSPIGNKDIFFAKFNSSGVFQWVRKFGGPGNEVFKSINALSNGNLSITGDFINTVDFDPASGVYSLTSAVSNSFISQYSPTGHFIRAGALTSASNNVVIRGLESRDDNLFLYGYFATTFDMDPGPGVQSMSSSGSNWDGFVVKYDSSLQVQWGQVIGGTGDDRVNTLSFDNIGNLIIAGKHNISTDFDPSASSATLSYTGSFIARYSNTFGFLSVTGIEYTNTQTTVDLKSVKTDLQNNLIVLGIFDGDIDVDPGPGSHDLGTVSGNYHEDSFLIQYTSSNQLASADQFGGGADQRMEHLIKDIHNNLWMIGYYKGSIDVELGPSTLMYHDFNYDFSNKPEGLIANYYLCNPSYNTITYTMCNGESYLFDNDTLTEQGAYTRYFTNINGCDSIVVLNLTINYVDNNITLVDSVFQCDATSAQFQWYNCTTQSNVPGATSNVYQAPDFNEYAAIITQNGCVAKTACMLKSQIYNTNLPELDWVYDSKQKMYPTTNPLLSVDKDLNLVLGCYFSDFTDFDFKSGGVFLNSHHLEDLGVAIYHPDGSFKSAFASGYDSTTTITPVYEIVYATRVDLQNNTIAIGKYKESYDFDPDTGVAMLPAPGPGMFISKINESSQLLWVNGFTGSVTPAAMAVGNNDNFIVCGDFYGSVDFDPGPGTVNLPYATAFNNCVFVVQYSSSGQFINAFSIFNNTSSGDVNVMSCDIDNSGNIIIGGEFNGDTDFDPGPGVSTLIDAGYPSTFIAKYSPTGQFIWAKRFLSAFKDVKCDNRNKIVGAFQSGLQKFDSTGNFMASFTFQATLGFDIKQIEIDNVDDVTILGDFTGTLTYNGNVYSSPGIFTSFVAKFRNPVTPKWGFKLQCVPYSIVTDQEQNIYVAGKFDGSPPFDADPGPDSLIISAPINNLLIAKYGNTCVTTTSITGNTVLCPVTSTVLDAGSGFASYSWSTGATTQSITVNQPGIYFVDVTNNLGCVYRDSVTVTQNPAPVIYAASSTQICQGDSVLLSAPPGYASYQWQRNFVNLPGVVSEDYYAKSAGKYRCEVTAAGCSGNSNMITVRVVCIPPGPNHQKISYETDVVELEVTAYPNPATGDFRVISNCDEFSKTNLVIYDSSNREIRRFSNHQNNNEFLVEGLAPGMYYGKLTCELGTKIVKIILLE